VVDIGIRARGEQICRLTISTEELTGDTPYGPEGGP
jgi:hypothetical protein